MNDLIRPSFYESFHAIWTVDEPGAGVRETADVVGPICETGDFLARDRELPVMEPGALLAVMSAGAYGFAMASNYNSRPRPPEILVNGDRYAVVRPRETQQDLVRGEDLAPWQG
jgi:diaminopimelate decarboxylase